MTNLTLRPAAPWSERLLHCFDLVLDRLERALRNALADEDGAFREAAHAAHLHRLAARGCNGQALT